MPLQGYSGGLLATALVAFLVIPVQYYVPDLNWEREELAPAETPGRAEAPAAEYLQWISIEHLPPFDLFLTISLLSLAMVVYLCDWIQRKLMERRIVKLNYYLGESVARLRSWDARQEQLEATLRMVQNATSEYNLLLYLLLRRHAPAAAAAPAPAPGKGLDDHLFRSTALDV